MSRYLACLLTSFLLLGLAIPARADSWLPATRAEYLSPDKAVRLTVLPRELAGNLAYFQDKVDGKEPAGQLPGSPHKQARGILERKGSDGHWRALWDKPLNHDVAPTRALVADSARHVVTLDNWHSAGYGDNVVVIYDATGQVVRSLGLKDILPESYVEALPHSVSSIWWGGEHRFDKDGNHLVLQVVVPSVDEGATKPEFVEIEVGLTDGAVITPTGPEFQNALATAAQINGLRETENQANAKRLAASLYGPKSDGEREWHAYLVDAFVRLEADSEAWPQTKVLADVGSPHHDRSVGWIKEALTEAHRTGDVVMIASPSSKLLADLLVGFAPQLAADSLKGVRLYVAAATNDGRRAAKAVAHTGVDFVTLDPAKPIAPRAQPAQTETRR